MLAMPLHDAHDEPKIRSIDIEIGSRIRERRLDLGMDQRELAQKVFLSHDLISRIELGKHSIKVWQLAAIAKGLQVSWHYLMQGD